MCWGGSTSSPKTTSRSPALAIKPHRRLLIDTSSTRTTAGARHWSSAPPKHRGVTPYVSLELGSVATTDVPGRQAAAQRVEQRPCSTGCAACRGRTRWPRARRRAVLHFLLSTGRLQPSRLPHPEHPHPARHRLLPPPRGAFGRGGRRWGFAAAPQGTNPPPGLLLPLEMVVLQHQLRFLVCPASPQMVILIPSCLGFHRLSSNPLRSPWWPPPRVPSSVRMAEAVPGDAGHTVRVLGKEMCSPLHNTH